MSARTSMGRKISTRMAVGDTIRHTAMSGLRMFRRDGLPIRTGSGFGKTIMAGLGSTTIHGAGRRSITVPGTCALVMAGLGSPDRDMDITGTILLWLASSVSAAASALDSVSETWDGWLSRRSSPITRGTVLAGM